MSDPTDASPNDKPFYLPSNGTEGHMFMETNCWLCTKDSIGGLPGSPEVDVDEGPFCDILTDTVCGTARAEWVHDPSTGWPGNAHCTKFKGLDHG